MGGKEDYAYSLEFSAGPGIDFGTLLEAEILPIMLATQQFMNTYLEKKTSS